MVTYAIFATTPITGTRLSSQRFTALRSACAACNWCRNPRHQWHRKWTKAWYREVRLPCQQLQLQQLLFAFHLEQQCQACIAKVPIHGMSTGFALIHQLWLASNQWPCEGFCGKAFSPVMRRAGWNAAVFFVAWSECMKFKSVFGVALLALCWPCLLCVPCLFALLVVLAAAVAF